MKKKQIVKGYPVYSFWKNNQEEVRIYKRKYKGYVVADIRIWKSQKRRLPRPIRGGLILPVYLLPNLKEGIEVVWHKVMNDPNRYYSGRRDRRE